MKIATSFKLCMVPFVATLALTACGSGGDAPQSTTAFINSFNSNISTPQSQSSAGFLDLFAVNFLDDGYTKTNLVANVQSENAAIAAGSVQADSAFPQVVASNTSITDCNAATNICILSTTLATGGPDSTTITSRIPVLVINGLATIVGNGSAVQPS